MRVKICGLTNLPDALAAVEAGADALGFMFYDRSLRHISVKAAADIIRALPPLVSTVGVFVDASAEVINEALAACRLSAVQLHGSERPEFCRRLRCPVIKAFRIEGPQSLEAIRAYETTAWLLDSFVPGKMGGTGVRFNWDLAARANTWGRPVILAGGLTPENVASAVKQVRPFAVDVSSGVEIDPGKKDSGKMRAFVAAAKIAAYS